MESWPKELSEAAPEWVFLSFPGKGEPPLAFRTLKRVGASGGGCVGELVGLPGNNVRLIPRVPRGSGCLGGRRGRAARLPLEGRAA